MILLLTMALMLDLAAVQEEQNLEKRSEQALEYADSAIDAARDAYGEGRWEETQAAMDQVEKAVELSYASLLATGKDPRDKSKHFKRAEKATRQILRRLEALRDSMSSVDHEVIDPVIANVDTIHDNLVMGIMTGN